MTDRCFRCEKPLGEGAQGILLMYRPRDPTEAPLYTLPRMFCKDCMSSFFEWSNNMDRKADLFNLLVEIDIKHTALALDLNDKYGFAKWDPDAYYTPLENRLNQLAEALGFEPHKIHEESYKHMKNESKESE